MAKFIVIATGYFFIFYGAVFIFLPQQMLMFITDAIAQSNSAIIDVRATYGGMSIAAGSTLLLLSKKHLDLALIATAIVLLSMASGRLIGIFLDGNANTMMWIYLVAEVVVGAIALFCLKKCEQTQ